MIPHCGGDTQRDNRFIKPHTRRIPRNIPKGETDNVGMHAVRTKVLHYFQRDEVVTLTHVSGKTRHSHEEEREESALAQVLFNTPPLRRDLRARSPV